MKSKKLIPLFIIAIVWVTLLQKEDHVQVSIKKTTPTPKITRSVASVPSVVTPPEQSPLGFNEDRPVITFNGKRSRRSHLKGLSFDRGLKDLPHNLQVVNNVRTISRANYRPEMGIILQELNGNVFFKQEKSSPEWGNVVYDRSTRMLYPISSNLRIEGITPTARQELLSQGYEEQYYDPAIKTLFVQNEHTEVLNNYQTLASQGLNVSLEIHRSVLRPK